MAEPLKVGDIVRGPDGCEWLVIEQEHNGIVGLTTWPATVVRSEGFTRVGRAEFGDGSELCRVKEGFIRG
jgi:hypothetical protein